MRQDNYTAIENAIKRHANGSVRLTDGKITYVNIAKEAQVGRATLYRFLEKNEFLRTEFEKARSGSANQLSEPPTTLHDALQDAKEEIKQLRKNLGDNTKRAGEHQALLKDKLFILKRMLAFLEAENENLKVTNQTLRTENVNLKRAQQSPTIMSLQR